MNSLNTAMDRLYNFLKSLRMERLSPVLIHVPKGTQLGFNLPVLMHFLIATFFILVGAEIRKDRHRRGPRGRRARSALRQPHGRCSGLLHLWTYYGSQWSLLPLLELRELHGLQLSQNSPRSKQEKAAASGSGLFLLFHTHLSLPRGEPLALVITAYS